MTNKKRDAAYSAACDARPASATFSGKMSGDMECFCWDDVPENECETIKDDPQWVKDNPDLQEPIGRLYPGDVLRFLGCERNKRYRFTITVEEAGKKTMTTESATPAAQVDAIVTQPREPLMYSVDGEMLRRLVGVCTSAVDNAVECLNDHDNRLGRTTKKNRKLAELYEQEIKAAESAVLELRVALGWPV